MNHIRQTFEKMKVPVCAINAAQHLIYWNQAAAATFGYAAQDVLGKPCWSVLQGNTLQGKPLCRRNCPLLAMIDQTQPAREFLMFTKGPDGVLHQLEVNAATIMAVDQTVSLVHYLRPCPSPAPAFALRLLGPVQLRDANGRLLHHVTWASKRQMALFAYLVLNRDHPVTPKELQHQFWPILPAEEVAGEITAVSQTLCHLLNLETPLPRVNGGYQLPGNILFWLDVNEFDKRLSQAAEEPDPAQEIRLLEEVVDLYQDDFLCNLPLRSSWIVTWRTHFQQGYLAALQRLSTLYEEASDLPAARWIYLNALKTQPVSGEYGRSFIHLLEANTTPSQTLRQCKRLISLLQSELETLLEACDQSLAGSDSPADEP
ncbi:MAG: PAS domain-containing protein [Anaerolineaceae bacterium]|nr:PAS domain-containing protein [Anaerolineaceae bacterium]